MRITTTEGVELLHAYKNMEMDITNPDIDESDLVSYLKDKVSISDIVGDDKSYTIFDVIEQYETEDILDNMDLNEIKRYLQEKEDELISVKQEHLRLSI